MNAAERETLSDSKWAWTSYTKLQWVQPNGLKLYEGRFQKELPRESPDILYAFVRQVIRFWAHRPVIAMRSICMSGKEPQTFEGAEIN